MRTHGTITKVQPSGRMFDTRTIAKLQRPIANFASALLVAHGLTELQKIAARRAPTSDAIMAAFDTLAAAAGSDAERFELGAQKLAFMKANGIR